METSAIIEILTEIDEEMLLANGLEEALVGYVERCAFEPVACYDYERAVQVFVDQGMTEEEAREWMEFNVVGAYMGEKTPMFLHDLRELKWPKNRPQKAENGVKSPEKAQKTA